MKVFIAICCLLSVSCILETSEETSEISYDSSESEQEVGYYWDNNDGLKGNCSSAFEIILENPETGNYTVIVIPVICDMVPPVNDGDPPPMPSQDLDSYTNPEF